MSASEPEFSSSSGDGESTVDDPDYQDLPLVPSLEINVPSVAAVVASVAAAAACAAADAAACNPSHNSA